MWWWIAGGCGYAFLAWLTAGFFLAAFPVATRNIPPDIRRSCYLEGLLWPLAAIGILLVLIDVSVEPIRMRRRRRK